jgi:hypothetical protein
MKAIHRERQQGVAYVWLAVILGALVAFTGLAVDTANMVWAGQQLQAAADAAALAGARRVRADQDLACSQAVLAASGNRVHAEFLTIDSEFDVDTGVFNRETGVFTLGSGYGETATPNAVRVTARRTAGSPSGQLPLFFGPIFELCGVNIQRTATAMIGGTTDAGIIVLNPFERDAFYVYGTPLLKVIGGLVHVNSDDSRATRIQGSTVECDADSVNIVGDFVTQGSPHIPHMNTGVDYLPDPLADLPVPEWNPADDLGTVSNSTGDISLSPGFYSGGISANGGNVTLDPGVYILDGAGLDITGNTNFYAEGCTFYITGSGSVELHGTGDCVISSPDPDVHSFDGADIYEGIGVFQDRANTNDALMVGTSLFDLEGTFYYPSAHLEVGGTSDAFGNQLIADTVDVYGTGSIVIDYDGRHPMMGTNVFLVQ